MDAIELRGVKTHNLKNFDLVLPQRKFYVITGVSGSGKSSLAFDTLYAEGQRRYLESVSAYARQFLERMPKPDLLTAAGIPPALAIQAKNVVTNARSTVGTQTEINDYLRVAFARAGKLTCPGCGKEVEGHDPSGAAAKLLAGYSGKEARVVAGIPLGKKGKKYLKEAVIELERQGFSEFLYDGAWMHGSAYLEKDPGSGMLYLTIDRLKILDKDRERLVDSLELGYRTGRGKVQVWASGEVLRFSDSLECISCGRTFTKPSPNLFSFNSPLGACPVCQGFGRVITIDWDLVVPDPSKSIKDGAIEPWTKASTRWELGQLVDFCERKRIPVKIPWTKLKKEHKQWILEGYDGDDYNSVRDFFEMLQKRIYKMHVRIFLNRYRGYTPCGACGMTRLKPDALNYRIGGEHQVPPEAVLKDGPSVQIGGKNIAEVQALSIDTLLKFFQALEFKPEEKEKIEPVRLELLSRIRFLKEVGLGYLTLDRMSRTLSGGEVERIHLASSLGSALVDTLYVLDEPSIGLHERDNQMLIGLLKKLRDLGNTVVVVEHDRTMIEAADSVIDLGPEGGAKGGRLIFQGTVDELRRCKDSHTAQYLSGKQKLERTFRPSGKTPSPLSSPPRRGRGRGEGAGVFKTAEGKIVIEGAKAHNLKSIRVEIPLGRFTVLTGVSGSGKSTLLYNILYHHYLKYRGQPVSQEDVGEIKKITGFDHIGNMVLIDQSPLGRSPRSNPATYTKSFDEIRKIFASTQQARRAGFDAGHFSFNVEKGRCPACKGDGAVKVEMHFLADIFVPCEACRGKRFKPGILEVEYRGKNVDQVLEMTVDEAADFFSDHKGLVEKLAVLKKIGLGYLRLGQPTLTLSGGEAQRLKLAYELSLAASQPTLYLLDEPTTGLHERDIGHLIRAFDELLSQGHSIFVIEHHMGMIGLADHVIDLGPEGGDQGGEVLYQGPLAGLLDCERSYTGQYLKKHSTEYEA